MKRHPIRSALALALVAAAAAAPAASAQNVGPDYVASDNVELVDRVKTMGDGVGATLVGDYLFVTSTKSLNIYDIKTDPEHPREVGLETVDVEFENEEVPTNGKILGISSQIGCKNPLAANELNPEWDSGGATSATGCLSLYDVSDPANVRYLTSVSGAGNHTSTCVFECQWFMGSTGAVTDARDPANAKLVGNWQAALPGEADYFQSSCHHLREIKPGIILGSCQPIVLMTTRAEDGATPLKPIVIATGANEDQRFIHSSRWPRGGADRFMLSGGETNAAPQCDDTVAAFMVWDASNIVDGQGGFVRGAQFTLVDEVRPQNGSYADGRTPYNGLGCSVHWFQEHPGFHNGGLVALAEYENGVRFLQITPQGKIEEKDFFLPLGGSTSAPHWNPNGKVVYAIDYTRGMDVLRYTGPDYVPAGGNEPARPGASCAAAAGFRSARARAAGSGLRFSPSLREKRPYTVEVFQQSSGRTVLRDRLQARFTNRKGSFTWNGRARGGRRLADGYYYARFTMRLADGNRDVRIVALRRTNGRFVGAPAFAQSTSCGVFTSYRLSSAVFGGRRNAPLRFSYRLAHAVAGVRVEVRRGKRLVRRFAGGGSAGRTYSFSLPARSVPRGATVTVRATVTDGPGRGQVLTAEKL